jgi:(2Fe-2S) ferredoxin
MGGETWKRTKNEWICTEFRRMTWPPIDDTEDLRPSSIESGKKLRKDGRGRITVHMSTQDLQVPRHHGSTAPRNIKCSRSDIAIGSSGCIGLWQGPLVTVGSWSGAGIYQRVDDQKAKQIFRQHVLGGKVQVNFALARGKAVNEEPVPNKSDLEGIIPG